MNLLLPHEDHQALKKDTLLFLLFALAACFLYVSSLYTYLLFHTLVEIFCVFVLLSVYVLSWNSRRLLDNHYFLFLALSFLSSGAFELVHALAYKGFGVFPGHDANLPTQLWIVFRYMFSLSFLAAPVFITRRLNAAATFLFFTAVTALLFLAIFSGHFPDCFLEGRGLTPFKIFSEYVIIMILLAAIGLLLRRRPHFDPRVLRTLIASLVSAAAAEAAFTQYISVYGPANLIGHFFLFLSAFLIYKAIVVTGITEPAALLFRNLELSKAALQKSEEVLQQAHNELAQQMEDRTRELHEKEVLLKEVHHRVKNNLQVISSLVGLQADNSTNEAVREVLRDVTSRVRSMALVHEMLYQSADLARIDFAQYSRSLLHYLWRAHSSATAAVGLILELAPLSLPVDIAVPCGLILNELAGNTLQHAFCGRVEGRVIVALACTDENRTVLLRVRDNGIGLPSGLNWRQPSGSLGLRLVQMLAGQLQATVDLNREGGTEFQITFRLPETANHGEQAHG